MVKNGLEEESFLFLYVHDEGNPERRRNQQRKEDVVVYVVDDIKPQGKGMAVKL